MEAISRLWRFGSANIELIISPTRHPLLLNSIMKEASITTLSVAFFTKKEVTGDEVKDSISAILLAYDYLDQLENELAISVKLVSETTPDSKSRYASLLIEMQRLHLKWQAFI